MHALAHHLGRSSKIAAHTAAEANLLDLQISIRPDCGWRGGTLIIGTTLPDTVLNALAGERLGDHVAGSGHDDGVVKRAACHGTQVYIDIETHRIAPTSLGLSRVALMLSPLRKARNVWMHEFMWREAMTGMGFIVFMLIMSGMLVMAAAMSFKVNTPFDNVESIAFVTIFTLCIAPMAAGFVTYAVRSVRARKSGMERE